MFADYSSGLGCTDLSQNSTIDVGIPSAAGADFSQDGKYRYTLWRIWDRSKPMVLFILLNPSTADEIKLDPTLTRCNSFAQQWGYGGMLVGNLFALRSTNPKALYKAKDPIGPENDRKLQELIGMAAITVVGWGTHGNFMDRGKKVLAMVKHPYCLDYNINGSPKHPLYLRGDMVPVPYSLVLDTGVSSSVNGTIQAEPI